MKHFLLLPGILLSLALSVKSQVIGLPPLNTFPVDYSSLTKIKNTPKPLALKSVTDGFLKAPANCIPASCSVLPLQLLEFDGKTIGNVNHLFWKTENEINTNFFELQRSDDAISFNPIGNIAALNTGGKNNYSFDDNLPMPGKNYYQLKMFDIDGRYKFSNVVLLQNTAADRFTVYPNPAVDKLSIAIYLLQPLNTTVTVEDLQGREISLQKYFLPKGPSTLQLNISSLSQGMYIIKVGYKEINKIDISKFIKHSN